MPPSRKVINCISRASEFREFAEKHVTGNIKDGKGVHMLGLYVSTVVEYQDGLLNLLKTGNHQAPAFALHRVIVEATVLAMWTYSCATDKQYEKIYKHGGKFPRFNEMVKELEKAFGNSGVFKVTKAEWKSLNEFTHTGYQQLSRRMDEKGNIVPVYADAEIINLIREATAWLAKLIIAFAQVIKRKEQSKEISDKFVELFPIKEIEDLK